MKSETLALAALAGALLLPRPARAQGDAQRQHLGAAVPPARGRRHDAALQGHGNATQGRVKCNLLPKAVVAPPQTLDAVRDGLADLSFIVHGYTPGPVRADRRRSSSRSWATPRRSISVAYQRIHDRMLAKHDEHKGVHVLGVFTHGPGQIFNTKRPVNSLKDLEGMKIRVGGGLVNDIAKALGTVPMLKPAPESYELLSQGVADGVFFPKESALSFKLVPLHQARHLRAGRPLQRHASPW